MNSIPGAGVSGIGISSGSTQLVDFNISNNNLTTYFNGIFGMIDMNGASSGIIPLDGGVINNNNFIVRVSSVTVFGIFFSGSPNNNLPIMTRNVTLSNNFFNMSLGGYAVKGFNINVTGYNNNFSIGNHFLYINTSSNVFSFFNSTVTKDNVSTSVFFPNITFFSSSLVDTLGNFTLFNNSIFINDTNLLSFNKSMNVTFGGVSYSSLYNYNISINGSTLCSIPQCINLGFSPVKFQVLGFGSSIFNFSTNLSIINIPVNNAPTNVTLLQPNNGNRTITNRSVIFVWSNATDVENNAITYELLVDDVSDFSSPILNATNISSGSGPTRYYAVVPELVTDIAYFWKVRAYDSIAYSDYSDTFNFTIASTVIISLPTSNINFGSPSLGDTLNTSNINFPPIVIRNDGNVLADVNLSLIQQLWSSKASPSTNFQYRIDNVSGQEGAFNSSGSTLAYTNIPLTNSTSIKQLNYSSVKNSANLHIQITVPTDESSGNKSALLLITGWVSA